ncbi:MAG: hypothetical protein NTX50_10100 [Candidatus Sumerlaeota bacterium]|nr:hypothetical protein [Candidatus Sumerlaeota bacterium]
MSQKKNEIAVDCIAIKRLAQMGIYEEIKDLKPEEEILYFQQKAASGHFAQLWKNLSSRKAKLNMAVRKHSDSHIR